MKVNINLQAYNLILSKDDIKLEKDFLYYILYLLEIFPEVDEFGFVSISSVFLKNIKWNYNDYIQYLLSNKIIRCNNKYKVDGQALGYRLDDLSKELNEEITYIEISDKYKNCFKSKDLSIEQEIMLKTYESITIDEDVYKFLNSPTLKKNMGVDYVNKISSHITNIKKGNIMITSSKTGRIFHPLCEMMSNLRYYVLIDNNRLWELDCSNSQPFFLALLIGETNLELYNNKDADLYRQLVITGQFYDYFMNAYNKINTDVNADKNEIKMYLLQSFFSDEKDGRSRYRSKTRKVFQQVFPTVYNFIINFKKDNYKELAYKLQEMESTVFVKEFNELFESKFLNCHDAIYVYESNIEYAKNTLIDIFHKKYGVIPNIKIKATESICSINSLVKERKQRIEFKKKINKNWSN